MNENERFKAIIEEIGKPISSIAKGIGISQPSLKACVDGRNKPSFDTIQKLVIAYPMINISWLLTGKGEMLLDNEEARLQKNASIRINKDVEDIRERIKLIEKIEKTNKLNPINDWYSSIEGTIDLIREYLAHYNAMENMDEFFDAYRKKNLEWNDVVIEFKKRIEVTVKLYKIIRPYEKVINEIYEKIAEFNDRHDRLYCIDDVESVYEQPEKKS